MTDDRADYKAMTLEDLQVAHSQLCALAHDNQLSISEELTVDFDDQGAGANLCRQIRNLLDDAGVAVEELAKDHEPEQSAPAPKKKKAKAKKAEAATAETDDGPAQQQESRVKKPAKKSVAKKAKVMKKTAAKKVAKKVGAKKAAAKGNGAAKKARAPKGSGPVAEVIKMLQSAKGCTRADILKKTGWKAVSVQQIAEGAGLKLKVSEERPFTYKAV